MGNLGFISPVKCIKSFEGYFLRSCVKAKPFASDFDGVSSRNFIPCTDPGGVPKVRSTNDKSVSRKHRVVHSPLGVFL